MIYRKTRENKGGHMYIMMNPGRTTLYVGVTANLHDRNARHADGTGSIFTARYNCTDLVYFETYPTITAAIARETQVKGWKRDWKFELIRSVNPDLKTLDLND